MFLITGLYVKIQSLFFIFILISKGKLQVLQYRRVTVVVMEHHNVTYALVDNCQTTPRAYRGVIAYLAT